MVFKSLANLIEDINVSIIPNLPIDIGKIYGIPRSGMIPASIISTLIGAELGIIGEELHFGERSKWIHKKNKNKILLVDDSIRTGKEMRNAIQLLKSQNLDFYTCAVYTTRETSHLVNFYASETEKTRIFEWNFAGIEMMKDSCWDLDGVICINAEKQKVEKINFCKPLYLPQLKVKAIITNRSERWRPETERWLLDHQVKYDKLIMQPFKISKERQLFFRPEEFKSRHYIKENGIIFIGGELTQAKYIAEITRKPVLCIETMQLFQTL